MKKIALFLGVLLLLVGNINAQKKSNYGFYVGCSGSWMKIDKSLFYDDSEVYMETETTVNPDTTVVNVKSARYLDVNDATVNPIFNFAGGGFYEMGMNELLGVRLNLMYNQYGYNIMGNVARPDSDGSSMVYDYEATTKLKNISMSILATFHILSDHLNLDFGIQPSFCVRVEKESHRSINEKVHYYTAGNEYKPFNLSLVGGLSGNLGEKFFIGLNYNYGLIDVLCTKTPYYNKESGKTEYLYSDSAVESKSSSLMLTIGCRF